MRLVDDLSVGDHYAPYQEASISAPLFMHHQQQNLSLLQGKKRLFAIILPSFGAKDKGRNVVEGRGKGCQGSHYQPSRYALQRYFDTAE